MWLAYAWSQPLGRSELMRRAERVRAHYQPTLADPFQRDELLRPTCGLILWSRPDPRLSWPLWLETDGLTSAASGVPTGCERVVGSSVAPREAATRLAQAMNADPSKGFELNPPFLMGVHDRHAGRLRLTGDALGVARFYQLRTRAGWVWSNRLGALPLFAGEAPELDEPAWQVFAAAGWFLGAMTPFSGAVKVDPGTIVTIEEGRESATVRAEKTDARARLVRPRRARLRESAAAAAEQAASLTTAVARAWDSDLAIALTGGRDSRVSAAAALAAGAPAAFNTGDQVPGELDVVRELIARAPAAMDHETRRPEPEAEPTDDLMARTRAIHLMHDGMRNPQEVRRSLELPYSRRLHPHLSGHGGELGHGFYYHNKKQLRRLERGGEGRMMERLEAAARRRHSAATPAGYAAYLEECRETLDSGKRAGLGGPVLLDWFYLAQRLAYRSGIGSREGRYSACVTPAFVRGCFDLKPKDRLTAAFHRAVIARLVPSWKRVGFFSSDSAVMPEIHRRRIWERPEDARAIAELLETDGGWRGIFDADRLTECWNEIQAGGGSADYEHVFYRLVWRAAFEDHARALAQQAVKA